VIALQQALQWDYDMAKKNGAISNDTVCPGATGRPPAPGSEIYHGVREPARHLLAVTVVTVVTVREPARHLSQPTSLP
jgi:hypothetical protein